jgi:hypothetical protein
MKTLTNIFGKKETKKTINNFLNQLDLNAMMRIKGGDEDDDISWPSSTQGSGNGS